MTEEEKPQEDECFDCPLYDGGKCKVRAILKLMNGDDFLIVGCGTRENYLASSAPQKGADKTSDTSSASLKDVEEEKS